MNDIIPFERYGGVNPLFLDFLRRRPDYYPDPPTVEAARERGRRLLGRKSEVPADAFRFRRPEARRMAADLADGRAVAVTTGHQIGLFTGPLFTLLKAYDAIRVARDLTAGGVPAVPVFYALTDDHDLEEIAKTARPGAQGPEIFVLEGADRSNRRPVGDLTIPDKIHEIVAALALDAKAPDAREILDAFASRYAPGNSYTDAFCETLFDLIDEPFLILDPGQADARRAAARFFESAVARRTDIENALAAGDARLRRDGRPVPAPHRPGVFPFFVIEKERRRVENVAQASARIASGQAWPSADVLSRPVLKSYFVPTAASILGPGEIAYHAQSLALFGLFDLAAPVLLPRSHEVWMGPPERRAVRALGLAIQDLLSDPPAVSEADLPQAARLRAIGQETDRQLASFESELARIDPTLLGSLETTRRKITYQLEQLDEKMRKAAEKKDEVTVKRRLRIATVVRPQGAASDRLYPPLVPLLAYGREALGPLRAGATGSTQGVVVVDLAAEGEPQAEASHAG